MIQCFTAFGDMNKNNKKIKRKYTMTLNNYYWIVVEAKQDEADGDAYLGWVPFRSNRA